ncbi:aldolase [bacterium]|nr:aldolase [bacterium]
MNMRRSKVLHKLRSGEVVNCFKLNLADGRAAEIAAIAGFDCIWVCMEHVANDWEVIEKQIWASKSYDTDVMVRVSRGGYSDYVRPLELDASGIMVPHLMSVEDARQVVRMTRFHPVGRRPVDGGNADGAYCSIEFREYLRQANEERFVVVQIEDPEPLEELDAIASVDGIDMLFFGPGDFSHGIGVPGEWNHPKILEARKRVVEAALAHGRFAGTVGGLWNLEELIAMGYRFINLGADVLALNEYAGKLIDGFRQATK